MMEISLVKLAIGKKAVIKKLEGGISFQSKLGSLNIRIGKPIKMVVVQPFGGPVVIEIDGIKIMLGRGMARHIYVEEEK